MGTTKLSHTIQGDGKLHLRRAKFILYGNVSSSKWIMRCGMSTLKGVSAAIISAFHNKVRGVFPSQVFVIMIKFTMQCTSKIQNGSRGLKKKKNVILLYYTSTYSIQDREFQIRLRDLSKMSTPQFVQVFMCPSARDHEPFDLFSPYFNQSTVWTVAKYRIVSRSTSNSTLVSPTSEFALEVCCQWTRRRSSFFFSAVLPCSFLTRMPLFWKNFPLTRALQEKIAFTTWTQTFSSHEDVLHLMVWSDFMPIYRSVRFATARFRARHGSASNIAASTGHRSHCWGASDRRNCPNALSVSVQLSVALDYVLQYKGTSSDVFTALEHPFQDVQVEISNIQRTVTCGRFSFGAHENCSKKDGSFFHLMSTAVKKGYLFTFSFISF